MMLVIYFVTSVWATASVSNVGFVWPLDPLGITSLFGPRLDPIHDKKRFHEGIDFDAPYGSFVVAAASGSVVFANWHKGHGRSVVIDHGNGLVTRYAHLSQIIALPKSSVSAGEKIGRVGNSGRSTGPHLHFEILQDNIPLDPLIWLEKAVLIE